MGCTFCINSICCLYGAAVKDVCTPRNLTQKDVAMVYYSRAIYPHHIFQAITSFHFLGFTTKTAAPLVRGAWKHAEPGGSKEP